MSGRILSDQRPYFELTAGFQSDGLSPKRISPVGVLSHRGRRSGQQHCDDNVGEGLLDERWREDVVSRLNLLEEKADERHEQVLCRLQHLTSLLQTCCQMPENHAHPSSSATQPRTLDALSANKRPEVSGAGRSTEREGLQPSHSSKSIHAGNPAAGEILPQTGI